MLAAATAIALTTPAAASADPWGGVNCNLTPNDPRCTVEVIYVGGGGGSGGGSGGNVVCKIGGVVVECHNGFGWLGSDGCYYGKDGGGFLPPNDWIRWCFDPNTGDTINWGIVYLPNPPAALAVITDRAIDNLSMPRPVIAANPSLATRQVVHVPVWWWVQPGWWQAQTATASAGGLTITARATPKKVTWYAGDGTSTICNGPGTPWTGSAAPTSASPTCGHTYTVPSASEANPDGKFQLRVVVSWDITWSGGGLSGSVPGVTTATTTEVIVTQLRAVITS
ncbi:hypothetical protein [Allorhizocola rhizosphaerae]|uniref:hypothetical protein n=1 Tax=Allorhizocola rhizosphaerae TaxID=1872709 RepID=UPI001FE576DC|nr:hypothetical protein [Allorhizocola rhizosphaerae]